MSSHLIFSCYWDGKSIAKEIEQNAANAYFPQASNVFFHIKTYNLKKKKKILMNAEWDMWNTHNCTFEAKL